ncbi:enoyl-CoA hydratase [Novosphingobium indicum]|nr:enoyl-CoA hydratase [Novosphingobium indicum]
MTAAQQDATIEADEPVLYDVDGRVAKITLNRPQYGNAQNDRMLYALDAAFIRAVEDDAIGAILLAGAGKHFSSGHDTGTPARYDGVDQIERRTPWYDPTGRPDTERLYAREQEVYLGLCRRWQALPKPVVGAVQGACIAGGLMLAWICDLIVAADDAYFMDPVVGMGIPGVEYFAHPYEMPTRIAREFLLLGEKFTARRAYEVGMVNRVVAAEDLAGEALAMAQKLADKPRFAMALTKQALNLVEDMAGKRNAMEAVYGLHHLAHAHNNATEGASMIWPKKK